jgi:hypothetical protein
MIVEVSPGRFSVQCDLCENWHPLVGDQCQVHEQSLEDRYVHVTMEYIASLCAETKTFCPACAKDQFERTFPKVINPELQLVEWYRNN